MTTLNILLEGHRRNELWKERHAASLEVRHNTGANADVEVVNSQLEANEDAFYFDEPLIAKAQDLLCDLEEKMPRAVREDAYCNTCESFSDFLFGDWPQVCRDCYVDEQLEPDFGLDEATFKLLIEQARKAPYYKIKFFDDYRNWRHSEEDDPHDLQQREHDLGITKEDWQRYYHSQEIQF